MFALWVQVLATDSLWYLPRETLTTVKRKPRKDSQIERNSAQASMRSTLMEADVFACTNEIEISGNTSS